MILKEAIEKAIEGGWQPPDVSMSWQSIALDPTFWRSLGKAVGTKDGSFLSGTSVAPRSAVRVAHEFYDLVLTGGNLDEFWEEILK